MVPFGWRMASTLKSRPKGLFSLIKAVTSLKGDSRKREKSAKNRPQPDLRPRRVVHLR